MGEQGRERQTAGGGLGGTSLKGPSEETQTGNIQKEAKRKAGSLARVGYGWGRGGEKRNQVTS